MSYYVITATAGHTQRVHRRWRHARVAPAPELQKVINNPDLMPLMVDEAIRWTSP